MLVPELARLLKQVELKPSLKTLTRRTGNLKRSRSGGGMDFKEVRNYIFGDDTRHIDWNVTSRMGELYVKEFHIENDRLVNLFLDVSKSMYTAGGEERTKFFVGYQIAFFIALISVYAGDQVNLICYTDNLEFYSGVLKSRDGVYRAFSEVFEFSPKSTKTDSTIPFALLKNKYTRKSVTYILSDFYGSSSLSTFRSLSFIHDLYAIAIFDPIETLEERLFSLFYLKNPETMAGGILNSTYWEDSKIVFSFFGNRLLRVGTNEDLGIPLLNFITR